MATTTIPWGDGSGDNIYLTYSSASGDQTVEVSSDANTGSARTKVVTFTSDIGSIEQILTVSQEAGAPQEYTATFNPSSYDSSDYSYYSITRPQNAYSSETSTSSATINLKRGSQAETWVYFNFNTSSIPANATITEVSCKAKIYIGSTSSTYISSRGIILCSGTTEKGDSANIPGSASTLTISGGSWTRAEMNDARIKIYAKRTTSSVNSNFAIYFYGATLTVKYTV